MASAVCSSVSGTSRVLTRCIATAKVVHLRPAAPAVGTSVLSRKYHISAASQGLKLYGVISGLVASGAIRLPN